MHRQHLSELHPVFVCFWYSVFGCSPPERDKASCEILKSFTGKYFDKLRAVFFVKKNTFSVSNRCNVCCKMYQIFAAHPGFISILRTR